MGNFALIKLKIKKRTYLLAVFPHFFNILNLALRIRAIKLIFKNQVDHFFDYLKKLFFSNINFFFRNLHIEISLENNFHHD
jgi:hypothetical protein